MGKRSGSAATAPAPRASLTVERWAAVRHEHLGLDAHGRMIVGPERLDLSTLHPEEEGARRLAEREDERMRMPIRRCEAEAHLRVVRVEIREIG